MRPSDWFLRQVGIRALLFSDYPLLNNHFPIHTVYPESFNSSHSAELDKLLTSKLREFALDLRVKWAHSRSPMSRSAAKEAVRDLKKKQLKVIYRILTIACGAPPKPDEEVSFNPFPSEHGHELIASFDSSHGSSPTRLGNIDL